MLFRQWLPANASPPDGVKTSSDRCTRPRPASAGLLYLRAHLNRDGERVVVTPPEGRERHTLRHDRPAKYRLSSRGDWKAAAVSKPQAVGTKPSEAATAGATPERSMESVMMSTAGGGMATSAKGSGVLVSSEGIPGKEEYTNGQTNTATATRKTFGRKPSRLRAALPLDLLRSPRTEYGIEGTADIDILRVEGVGGDPRIWESIPSVGLPFPQLPAEAAAGKKVPDAGGKYPLPCTGSDLPATSYKTNTAKAAAQAASWAFEKVEHLHRHVSTLEMISAMAHMPPVLMPPECVEGVEISIPVINPQPAVSSPRRIRTVAGADHCATDGDRHCHHELLGTEKPQEIGGGQPRRVAAPCKSLLKSCSWAGGDESIGTAACRRFRGVTSHMSGEQRQVRGVEDQQETHRAEDRQLHVNDSSGNTPRPCSVKVAKDTCATLGRAMPENRGGGGAGGAGGEGSLGEDEQSMTTPFSRCFLSWNAKYIRKPHAALTPLKEGTGSRRYPHSSKPL